MLTLARLLAELGPVPLSSTGAIRWSFHINSDIYFAFQDDLKAGLPPLGINISDNVLNIMFTEADRDEDGRIGYEGNSSSF